jgi:hypothetical protein
MDDEVENLDDIEHPFPITNSGDGDENDGKSTELTTDDDNDKDESTELVAPESSSEKPKVVGKFIPKHNQKALVHVPESASDKQVSEVGESSKSAAVEIFKVPDKPPLKKQRIVLEEDQYATVRKLVTLTHDGFDYDNIISLIS